MKTKLFLLILCLISLWRCSSNDSNIDESDNPKKILLLLVDYTTNIFEGGAEIVLEKQSDSFTIQSVYKEPSDFGNIKLFYKELNQLLFDGDIIWMGKGEISFPSPLLMATDFERTLTTDFIAPREGFESIIINANFDLPDYSMAWASAQSVVLARNYLHSNPDQKVKTFFYQPSVGDGDPLYWKWIFILKS